MSWKRPRGFRDLEGHRSIPLADLSTHHKIELDIRLLKTNKQERTGKTPAQGSKHPRAALEHPVLSNMLLSLDPDLVVLEARMFMESGNTARTFELLKQLEQNGIVSSVTLIIQACVALRNGDASDVGGSFSFFECQ